MCPRFSVDGRWIAYVSNESGQPEVYVKEFLPGSGGNVRERAFRDVWENSPWLREVRAIRRRDLPTCKSCARISYCGRCHAQALVEDGDLYGPSSYARQRAELLEALAAGAPVASL